MKLKDALENYYVFTGKASDVLRQLSFAGIAIIWMFKLQAGGQTKIPEALILPAAIFTGGLAFDLLQYLSASAMWGGFARYRELQRKGPRNRQFKAPRWINWPGNAFFVLKALCASAAYILLLLFLIRELIEKKI
jgi:hypothetical protein